MNTLILASSFFQMEACPHTGCPPPWAMFLILILTGSPFFVSTLFAFAEMISAPRRGWADGKKPER